MGKALKQQESMVEDPTGYSKGREGLDHFGLECELGFLSWENERDWMD